MKDEYLQDILMKREILGISGHKINRPPLAKYPTTIERRYTAYLIRFVNSLNSSINDTTKAYLGSITRERDEFLRKDGFVEDAEELSVFIVQSFGDVVETFLQEEIVEDTAQQILLFTGKEQARSHKAMFGIPTITSEVGMTEQMSLWSIQNSSLIKNISDTTANSIERIIIDGVSNGLSSKQMEKQIFGTGGLTLENSGQSQSTASAFRKAKNRARLIAVDQVGKLNSQLTQKRQRELGIESYVWMNSRDIRVRGNPAGLYPKSEYNHWSRNGEIFYWDNPPADGNAGMPIRCRCVAGANFEEYSDILNKG